MENNPLLALHKNNWYNSVGIDFKDIEPHIKNFEKVDELVPPGPRFFIVVNLHSYQFEFLGKGQYLVSGYDNELVKKEGIGFQTAHMHPEDGEFIVKFSYQKFSEIILSQPEGEQKNIVLQHNYRFRHKEGHYVHLMEQIWGVKTDAEGKLCLLLTQVYELPMLYPFKINMLVKKLLPNQKDYDILYSHTYPESEPEVSLSKREKEIIPLLAAGYTSTKIAEKLCISSHTVRTHRKNMLQKLNMNSTNELMAYGITNGIL